METIGVLTSGGDAPGMNAAIRAVVRTSLFYDMKVFGIRHGFDGLVRDDITELNSRSVADIIHRGGTILRTARSVEFPTVQGREKAQKTIARHGIEGLVVIGGDGSFRGAMSLSEAGVKVIGLPGTIDNDIPGTDATIGFDTAVNNGVDAINKIRDTATSHERVYVIEVMGRHTGHIALATGLAGGAESVLIPEIPYDLDEMVQRIQTGYQRGKGHTIVVVAEGIEGGPINGLQGYEGESPAFKIGRLIQAKTGLETRVIILGHLQRGGTPTVRDQVLASRMGARAVQLLKEGKHGLMVGNYGEEIVAVPLDNVFQGEKKIDVETYRLINILSLP